jgi:hypothetical protein
LRALAKIHGEVSAADDTSIARAAAPSGGVFFIGFLRELV